MTDPASQDASATDGRLDDIRIRVVFELGRIELPLGSVETLGEGHVFDLGKPQSGAIDIIAGGRRIGTGSLVKVGDGVGVRVGKLQR